MSTGKNAKNLDRSATSCEACGADSQTIESRRRAGGAIRRRRQCRNCNVRWSTVEVRVEPGMALAILPVTELQAFSARAKALVKSLGGVSADLGDFAPEPPKDPT